MEVIEAEYIVWHYSRSGIDNICVIHVFILASRDAPLFAERGKRKAKGLFFSFAGNKLHANALESLKRA